MKNYAIKSLNDCQEQIPSLALLWYEEISRHWVPQASVEKAKQKLAEHLNSNKMPMAWVALHEGQAIGMACLRENDGIRPGLTPWLGSLVVHPHHRKHKIGEALIDCIKSQAKHFGHSILYLLAFDQTIPHWYGKLGWTHVGHDKLFGHTVTVMSITL